MSSIRELWNHVRVRSVSGVVLAHSLSSASPRIALVVEPSSLTTARGYDPLARWVISQLGEVVFVVVDRHHPEAAVGEGVFHPVVRKRDLSRVVRHLRAAHGDIPVVTVGCSAGTIPVALHALAAQNLIASPEERPTCSILASPPGSLQTPEPLALLSAMHEVLARANRLAPSGRARMDALLKLVFARHPATGIVTRRCYPGHCADEMTAYWARAVQSGELEPRRLLWEARALAAFPHTARTGEADGPEATAEKVTEDTFKAITELAERGLLTVVFDPHDRMLDTSRWARPGCRSIALPGEGHDLLCRKTGAWDVIVDVAKRVSPRSARAQPEPLERRLA